VLPVIFAGLLESIHFGLEPGKTFCIAFVLPYPHGPANLHKRGRKWLGNPQTVPTLQLPVPSGLYVKAKQRNPLLAGKEDRPGLGLVSRPSRSVRSKYHFATLVKTASQLDQALNAAPCTRTVRSAEAKPLNDTANALAIKMLTHQNDKSHVAEVVTSAQHLVVPEGIHTWASGPVLVKDFTVLYDVSDRQVNQMDEHRAYQGNQVQLESLPPREFV